MNKLWQIRLKKHQQQQFRYLRYVFNDHFVIALIFLFGAGVYGYAQLLRYLPTPCMIMRWPVLLILMFTMQFGRLATLIEPADNVFLLPQTPRIYHFLQKGRRYSCLIPAVFILLVNLALYPLLVKTLHYSWPLCINLALSCLLLKDGILRYELALVYQERRFHWLIYGFELLIIGLTLWMPYGGCVVALLFDVMMAQLVRHNLQNTPLQWQYLINNESQRMTNLYRFYNLFTDVPGFNSRIKRRHYLDWLLKKIPQDHQHTYAYLYARGFLRRTEYSNLFLRLWIINLLVLCLFHYPLLVIGINALFAYLICLQLMPLFNQYVGMIMTHLYPLTFSQRIQAFITLLQKLLLLQWFTQALVMLLTLPTLTALIAIFINGLLITLLLKGYLPRKLAN